MDTILDRRIHYVKLLIDHLGDGTNGFSTGYRGNLCELLPNVVQKQFLKNRYCEIRENREKN
jgi:hypothetical protein